MDRFYSKIDKSGNCWLWTGTRHRMGYGRFKLNGKMMYTHRIMWELKNGPIPDDLFVLHKCDNPPCCNPEHLELGDHSKNISDAIARGLYTTPDQKGEKHSQARLSEKDVLEIRKLYHLFSNRELAIRFGVSRSLICEIYKRKKWKHI